MNLYSRVRVLKIASFEGPMILRGPHLFVEKLGGGNSNIFGMFHPEKLGKMNSILTSIFSKGLKPPTRKICVCSKERSR